MSGEIVISEDWTSNDYANIITISAAAISSVLLVIFKSRCKTIDICCGMINCLRDPKSEDSDTDAEAQPEPEPEPEPIVPPVPEGA